MTADDNVHRSILPLSMGELTIARVIEELNKYIASKAQKKCSSSLI